MFLEFILNHRIFSDELCDKLGNSRSQRLGVLMDAPFKVFSYLTIKCSIIAEWSSMYVCLFAPAFIMVFNTWQLNTISMSPKFSAPLSKGLPLFTQFLHALMQRHSSFVYHRPNSDLLYHLFGQTAEEWPTKLELPFQSSVTDPRSRCQDIHYTSSWQSYFENFPW